MNIRLNKYLSDAGVCSRRGADELINKGKVLVNKKPALLGMKIDTEKDEVEINGEIIEKRQEEYTYYALNKPQGVISTSKDEKGRESVLDLVPGWPRVYPVGRLDKDSEGLIILTDDGELTNELTHPKKEHEKEYIVWAKYQEGSENKDHTKTISLIEERFLSGIRIEGKPMKADKVKATVVRENRFDIQMTIHTGYNRQIRKMCDKMGLEVIKLIRIRIAKLDLKSLNLDIGKYKKISRADIL